jgi:hypothetical protein
MDFVSIKPDEFGLVCESSGLTVVLPREEFPICVVATAGRIDTVC